MSVILCAPAISACGGGEEEPEGTIPSEKGASIVAKLDDVQAQLDSGDCDAAEASAAEIQTAIADLGPTVEGELEEALVEASGNLVTLVREDCEEPPPPPPAEPGATGEEGVVEG